MAENQTCYLHGVDSEEQSRLGIMNRLLNESCLKELRLEGGERFLDVGCGLAQFSRMVARAIGSTGRVLGIERESRQLAEAARQARTAGEEGLVELRAGDALNLPLQLEEEGAFDVVFARFVLEHVRDPLAVVKQLVRAARPGGRIVLTDDDHDLFRLHPEPPGLNNLLRAYIRLYDRLGTDPYVGRRLAALLHEAGAPPVRITWLFFGACVGQPEFSAVVENMAGIFEGAKGLILGHGLLDCRAYDQAIEAFRCWAQLPAAAFWYGIPWAEGIKKSGR